MGWNRLHHHRSWGVLVLAMAASGCGDDTRPCGGAGALQDEWTLSSQGIEVRVQRSPYRLSVLDGAGDPVLESAEARDGDGYGALGWTSGEIIHEAFVAPGYFSFSAFLDPYRDRFEVVGAEERAGELLVTLAGAGSCIEASHAVRDSALRVEARSLDDGQVPRAWSSGFLAGADEGFLGFGERFNKTDQRGVDVFSWAEEGGVGAGEGTVPNRDNPFPSGETMTYYPVPFFLSTSGYGFWLDTTYRSEFELVTTRDDAWRVWHTGPTTAFEIYVPVPGDSRPWPYHIVDRFTEATGRPMLPPAWTLGPRRRISRHYTVDGQPEIEVMRDEDLAITSVDDSMHFYPSANHIGKEAGLASWIDDAEALGYRVNGYYNSFVDKADDSPMFPWASEGLEGDYFLRNEGGEHPDLWIITGSNTPSIYLVDFTNPEATAWYQSSFDWALELGYSGWMYDFGEYVPPAALAHDGKTGEELHNLYPVLYAKAIHDALESSEHAGDWLAFMRSGYTGSSQYVPTVWSGDPAASFEESDGLPSMVPAALNLGISGAPNSGGDIGGFHCTKDGAEVADEELLTRWIQQGSMMPTMQDQNACVGGGVKADIWTAPAAKEAWREYARLHTRLFPYLYTLAHQANQTGAPIMRHMFLEHPDRNDLKSIDDAHYLGSSLLVAPVMERGARDKSVVLPDGASYLDWKDGVAMAGGQTVTIDAPLSKLPLLLRENHLIPLLDPAIDTLSEEDHPDVVGPADVADVYDVVGYIGEGGVASFQLWDGEWFTAELDGSPAPPALSEASDEGELSTCDGCYLIDTTAGGVTRVRISTTAASVTAGGLSLSTDSSRRVRWDLYIAP